MTFRIPPPWWPALAALSPVIAPLLLARNRRFKKNAPVAAKKNEERFHKARKISLSEVGFLDLTVLSEWKTLEGFRNEAGVSYFFKSDLGSLLYDVGFGTKNTPLAHNASKLGLSLDDVDGVAISHLHPDHMGGLGASRHNSIVVPKELGSPNGKPCFLPEAALAPDFDARVVEGPMALCAGMASTGPLTRNLFFLKPTEEQALLALVKGKGLVVVTGCGHQTAKLLLDYVRLLSNEPIHAIVGGFHLPVAEGRGAYGGIQAQSLIGTGKPPWQSIGEAEIKETIDAFNEIAPKYVYLSAHDSCDHSIERLQREVDAKVEVLRAGGKYRF